jgi:hypothetical protein
MAQYQSDMASYNQRKAEWDALDPSSRMRAHKAAEKSSLKRFTIGFFILATITEGIIGYRAGKWGSTILFSIMAATFIGGIVISRFLWFVTGRIFRGLFFGVLWFIGLAIAGAIIYNIGILEEILGKFPQINNGWIFSFVIGAVGFILGVVFEILGEHHAYGGPTQPSMPRQ